MNNESRRSFDGGCFLLSCGCLSGGCLGMVLIGALATGLLVYGLQIGMVGDPREYAYIHVEGDEMSPALQDSDWVLVDREEWAPSQLSRGDIVWLEPPENAGRTGRLFLRVAGLPGESVSLGPEGHILIDGNPIEEKPFSEKDYRLTESPFEAVQVREHEFYLLGEEPSLAKDSRHWGPVGERYLRGIASAILFPPHRVSQLNPESAKVSPENPPHP